MLNGEEYGTDQTIRQVPHNRLSERVVGRALPVDPAGERKPEAFPLGECFTSLQTMYHQLQAAIDKPGGYKARIADLEAEVARQAETIRKLAAGEPAMWSDGNGKLRVRGVYPPIADDPRTEATPEQEAAVKRLYREALPSRPNDQHPALGPFPAKAMR